MKTTAIIMSAFILSTSAQAGRSFFSFGNSKQVTDSNKNDLSLSFPINVEMREEIKLDDIAEVLHSSPTCGKVYTFDPDEAPRLKVEEAGFLALVDPGEICRAKPGLLSCLPFKRFQPKSLFSYNSPSAALYIGLSKDTNESKITWGHLRSELDEHLLEKMQQIGKRMFADEMRGLNQVAPDTNQATALFESLFINQKSRLPLNTRQRIDLITTFYPEIEREIISDRNSNLRDLRPMLCYLNQDRLYYQRMHMISHVAGAIALSTGIAAIAIASHGTAVPLGLAIAATTTGVVSGAVDLAHGIHRLAFTTEASRIGKIFEKIAVGLEVELEKLDKFPNDLSPERRAHLSSLRVKFDSIATQRRSHRDIHKAQIMTRAEIAGALSTIVTAGIIEIDPGMFLQVINFLTEL